VEFWSGDPAALVVRRPVLVGFPQDEGVRRNHGRPGADEAPREIRHWLYRLTPWDGTQDADLASLRPLDLGDLRRGGVAGNDLEATQAALGEVVGALLLAGVVPIILGGGHETAFGHYLGYVRAQLPVGIINLDAHLDVRPWQLGQGHSGSPFRQALEHPDQPLRGDRYVCLGTQPFSASREHAAYLRRKGGVIRWAPEVRGRLREAFTQECERLAALGCSVHVTLDGDVVRAADVPGVSAPNPLGLSGEEVAACARAAGESTAVSSFDLVEINPRLDRDGQSTRWAASAVWHFLTGLTRRIG
jgi:formiminoglutamase